MENMEMMSKIKINSAFWSQRRVLVTGHTGFKGAWLSLWLQSMGASLRGIALSPSTDPDLFTVANVKRGMEHLIVDIRDFATLNPLIKEFQPEIIFHMAAQPIVRLSYIQPLITYETNVMGTLHVLESARLAGSVKAIVNVTTDKCYENKESLNSYSENDPLGGFDPYSSSKSCSELVSYAYRNSFLKKAGTALATARAGNVIGGGDWSLDRLVPDTLSALEKGGSVLIRNPQAIRPWQHVLEPLSGYLMLAESLYKNGQLDAEAWNFGPRDEGARSVLWVVKNLCKNWGANESWMLDSKEHPYEASILKLDIKKAEQRLGWTPTWPLDTALQKITEWHQAWMSGRDMRAFCLKQIDQYGLTI